MVSPPIDVLKSYAGWLSPHVIDFLLLISDCKSRTIAESSRVSPSSGKEDSIGASRDGTIPARRRLVPPFTPSHDIPRGVIEAIQSTFSYGLMLAVM